MGKLVVIEGLDGSGKATQTAMLEKALCAQGKNVRAVSFPNYESPSSALVRMYLEGAFGQNPEGVNAYAASSFYAVDRYASYMRDWGEFYNGGGLILADRYTTSNAIHQCAKLPQEQWEEYNSWLLEYEYKKLQIPRPSLVIYLDVEPNVSQDLLSERYKDEGERDIHEKNLEYLLACRKAAAWCAQRYGWKTVQCTKNGNMRSRDEIAKEIMSIVKAELPL